MVAMDTTDLVRNYSKCPLKKRPVLIVQNDEQSEPENLSTKPEDLSRNSGSTNNNSIAAVSSKPYSILNKVLPKEERVRSVERIYAPKPTYAEVPLAQIKEEEIDTQVEQGTHVYHPHAHYPEQPIELSNYRNWSSPITPPIYYNTSGATNENLDPIYMQVPNYKVDAQYCKEETLYKSNHLPLYNPYTTTLDLRTNYNNNVIKSDLSFAANPKRFTPYRVDRPIFNVFPLSPASSQASSYNSYESPRRSVSPISTNSSLSENLPANYSVFQNVSSLNNSAAQVSAEQKHQHQNNHHHHHQHHQHHRHQQPQQCSPTLPMPQPHHQHPQQPQPQSVQPKSEKSLKNAHYQCPDCSKSYSTYSGLSKHLQFHCPAVEGNQAKKSFSCKKCDKVYTSLGALKMHIRTHTLPCKCDICGKAFSRPWLLQGHIRTHTGEKPFTCQHCHRAFADRSNLRAHLQTHSEIKKYSCTTCSKTFSRMSLLTKHMEVGCPGYQLNHNLGYNINQMVQTKTDISVY